MSIASKFNKFSQFPMWPTPMNASTKNVRLNDDITRDQFMNVLVKRATRYGGNWDDIKKRIDFNTPRENHQLDYHEMDLHWLFFLYEQKEYDERSFIIESMCWSGDKYTYHMQKKEIWDFIEETFLGKMDITTFDFATHRKQPKNYVGPRIPAFDFPDFPSTEKGELEKVKEHAHRSEEHLKLMHTVMPAADLLLDSLDFNSFPYQDAIDAVEGSE